jgi:hypothetical protein
MGTFTYQIPVAGTTLNSLADPQISTALQILLTWGNDQIDPVNLSTTVNQSGQTVKGATSIATSQSTSSTTYTTLATPDQVTGLVLPANGLIAVWYQAAWQESVASAARAAIFIGSNQVQFACTGASPVVQETANNDSSTPNINRPLYTRFNGLVSGPTSSTSYGGDVTTVQIVGSSNSDGGPCYIFAAAGSYTVSVTVQGIVRERDGIES